MACMDSKYIPRKIRCEEYYNRIDLDIHYYMIYMHIHFQQIGKRIIVINIDFFLGGHILWLRIVCCTPSENTFSHTVQL